MSLSTAPSEKALAEAASWFARLKRQDVPQSDMEAFQVWFSSNENKRAYDAVDALWRRGDDAKNAPEIRAAVADALSRNPLSARSARERAPRRTIGLPLAFGAALILLVGGSTYFVVAPKTYSTAIGEQRTVRLADNSTLTLDTNSKAIVRLGSRQRRIKLVSGQALFEVAHDANRPFVVQAGKTSVTALGTKFDVRKDNGGATVTLVQGSVEVSEDHGAARQVWRLTPGQKVNTATPSPKPIAINAVSEISWTTGRLELHGVTLREAVTRFNRYERRHIELEEGPWGDERVTGVFDVDDTDTFVSSVAELHDLKVVHPSKSTIRLARSGDGVAAP